MIYSTLLPLVKKTGSLLSPRAFQEKINVVFHDFEASNYDEMHSDMRDSLQEQIDLLVNDLFKAKKLSEKKMKLLDIGCGTGLSTQILLKSQLGHYVDDITLLDTSLNMLKQAEEKAKKWNKNYSIVNSDISNLKGKYDIIMICSVLHHIPDLEFFLSQVDNVLNPDGILIHLQDPNGDYFNDENYIKRVKTYNDEKRIFTKKEKISDFIPKKWKQYLNRKLGRKNYIDLVNDQLLAEKVIKKRMSSNEIWSVTDIHVQNEGSSGRKGISLLFLQKQLQNFSLINQRSYGFYGALKSELAGEYKENEIKFIAENNLSGRNISCIWRKIG